MSGKTLLKIQNDLSKLKKSIEELDHEEVDRSLILNQLNSLTDKINVNIDDQIFNFIHKFEIYKLEPTQTTYDPHRKSSWLPIIKPGNAISKGKVPQPKTQLPNKDNDCPKMEESKKINKTFGPQDFVKYSGRNKQLVINNVSLKFDSKNKSNRGPRFSVTEKLQIKETPKRISPKIDKIVKFTSEPSNLTPVTDISTNKWINVYKSIFDDREQTFSFHILKGQLVDPNSNLNYFQYRQEFSDDLETIFTLLGQMELICRDYSIPSAIIDGSKIAAFAGLQRLRPRISKGEMADLCVNRDHVVSLLDEPGRRYVNSDGLIAATITIQKYLRGYLGRKLHTEMLKSRKNNFALSKAATILSSSVTFRAKKLARTKRNQALKNFHIRKENLCERWREIKSKKHIIIHIPSFGYSEKFRGSYIDFKLCQSMQISRICDISDPNVRVIYVSPVSYSSEMAEYYDNFFNLTESPGNESWRFKVIVPENSQSDLLINCQWTTSFFLKYSDNALREIKKLIEGEECYIVTGHINDDDLEVANILQVPIFASNPTVAHLISSKNGAKKLFVNAGVDAPPSAIQITTKELFCDKMALLIASNIDITKWILKVENYYDSKGIAIFKPSSLKCYSYIKNELENSGNRILNKLSWEQSYIRISDEIWETVNSSLVINNLDLWENVHIYFEKFFLNGGVIEAHPPGNPQVVTCDLMIEPDGRWSILSSADQITVEDNFSHPLYSYPQNSINSDLLGSLCGKIAEECIIEEVIGYVSVDYITFIHPKSTEQIVWGLDLCLKYSDCLAQQKMMNFICKGGLNTSTFTYEATLVETVKRRRPKVIEKYITDKQISPQRFAISSNQLFHMCFSNVHYSTFFKICRAHGFGFDLNRKIGSIFTVIDCMQRENFGLLVVEDDLLKAYYHFVKILNELAEEFSLNIEKEKNNIKLISELVEKKINIILSNRALQR